MRPLRLSLEGFGTFRERVDIDLTGIELFALVGATGAGKSTVIDAITFALYGSVARYDDNRNVVNAINQTSTRARVQLDFELADRTYTAVRVVVRTATGATTREARLECDGVVHAHDPRGMTAAVGELLGLDVEQFNRTVVLPQGRFAGFLHDTPANRQRTLRQLLGFEIYSHIGQLARRRADDARIKLGEVESEIAERADELTAERRTELQRALELTAAVAEKVRSRSAQRDQLVARVEPLRQRAAAMTTDVVELTAISIPPDAAALDGEVATSAAQLEAATSELAAARGACGATNDAVAAGPDLARSRVLLERRRDAAKLTEQVDSAVAGAAAAERALAEVTTRAAAVTARQRELDEAAESARAKEQQARAAAAAVPHAAELDNWQQRHERHAQLASQLLDADEQVRAAAQTIEPTKAALAVASAAEDESRERLGRLRMASGVALVVGEPCPVCRQEVHELPSHDLSAELAQAEAEHARHRSATTNAGVRHDAAVALLHTATATADALRASAASAQQELVGVPEQAEIDRLRTEATGLAQTVDEAQAAATAAVIAAAKHRTDPQTLDSQRALDDARARATEGNATVSALQTRLNELSAELADAPSVAELTAAIEAAGRLVDAAKDADERRRQAEQAAEQAQAECNRVRQRHADATNALVAARERVARLGPPEVVGKQLLSAWHDLAGWAEIAGRALDADRTAVADEAQRVSAEIDTIDRDVREACAAVLDGGVDGADLASLRLRLASRTAQLEAAITMFDQDVERLGRQRQRAAALQERAEVAHQLAYLLRSDQFEEWLMVSALCSLADSASVRLRELSGGQFSLELCDGSFMVRDHSNADELRSAKTLSGGETFLASLSLALALADSTTELAAEGAPPIESIFLDEGFGTLDPATLDTVAAAIEDLGASGRMVGIVTHIEELAERMPVRFEVTRAGGTASIQRVEQ